MLERDQKVQANFRINKDTKFLAKLLSKVTGVSMSEIAEAAFASYFNGEAKDLVEPLREMKRHAESRDIALK